MQLAIVVVISMFVPLMMAVAGSEGTRTDQLRNNESEVSFLFN